MLWYDKRYHSLNFFLRETFGCKVGKIVLNTYLSCPNRDGTISSDGCIFCLDGSHYFDEMKALTIEEQFLAYKLKVNAKWKDAKYIAYFQAFTNTYGALDYLEDVYFRASNLFNVVAISIATRPDCLSDDVLKILKKLRKKIYVFVELGFQTANSETVKLINRCYENEVFDKAVVNLKNIGVNVVAHTIFGLPYETKLDMMNTIRYLNMQKIDGIKIQILHVFKNTKLYQMYLEGLFNVLTLDEYTELVVEALSILSPSIVVHRINGDSPSDFFVAPSFCNNKRLILNSVDKKLRIYNIWQGSKI